MSPKLYYFGIIYKSSKGIETWYIGANHTHKFQDKEKADKWTKQACLEYISKYNIYNNIYILESVE